MQSYRFPVPRTFWHIWANISQQGGFSMETQHMLENSRAKLKQKHLDMICANNLKVAGAGFGTDTNVVTLIQAQKEQELPLQSKEAVGHAILDVIAKTLS